MVTNLRALDLNEYESRAYLAMLGADALTAYEVGKRAGIPLSRCYEVARSLVAKGMAMVQPGETPRYRALDPGRAIARRRAAVERDLTELESALEQHAARQRSDEAVWVLRGRIAILTRAVEMVDAARNWVELRWPESADGSLAAAVTRARARGVNVGDSSSPRAALLVARDGEEALIGQIEPGDRCLATETTQSDVVALLSGRTGPRSRVGWLDWEQAKVRRLLESVPGLGSLER